MLGGKYLSVYVLRGKHLSVYMLRGKYLSVYVTTPVVKQPKLNVHKTFTEAELGLLQHPRWMLTIITKSSILDVAAVLDPSLVHIICNLLSGNF